MARQPVLVLTRDFQRDQACLNAKNRRSLGLREAPVAAVTGSVGRTHLAAPERLAEWVQTDRYEGIVAALNNGAILPPVSLYLLDGHYYILDGHHRVAAARQLGILDLDAEVTEFLPTPDAPAADWHRARAAFERDTGLIGPHIRRHDGYDLLRRQIEEHAWYLGERGEAPRDFRAAADRWQREVYLPVLAEMSWRRLPERCPTLTAGEIYLALCDHKWFRGEAVAADIGFEAAIAEFGRPRWLIRLRRAGGWLAAGASALVRRVGLDLSALTLPA
jgi:hypothetical protein